MSLSRFGTSSIVGPQGPQGVYNPTLSLNAQIGAGYTLAATDPGKLVSLANSSAITLLVPNNATISIPIGSQVNLWQAGSGQVTVTADAGVTVTSRAGLKMTGINAVATLMKVDTNQWLLVGAVTP